MHGLINRSLECFLTDTYGREVWQDVVKAADLGFDKFESMFEYDDALTYAVLDAAEVQLSKSRKGLLEDLGTYLVSNPEVQSLRRLLRFGGENFIEFLHSLDDLHERAKLAVPELELPELQLKGTYESGDLQLHCTGQPQGFCHVMIGLIRAMADDYGALVILEYQGAAETAAEVAGVISIELVQADFADGREFSLAGPT